MLLEYWIARLRYWLSTTYKLKIYICASFIIIYERYWINVWSDKHILMIIHACPSYLSVIYSLCPWITKVIALRATIDKMTGSFKLDISTCNCACCYINNYCLNTSFCLLNPDRIWSKSIILCCWIIYCCTTMCMVMWHDKGKERIDLTALISVHSVWIHITSIQILASIILSVRNVRINHSRHKILTEVFVVLLCSNWQNNIKYKQRIYQTK